jgi:hypothetical protein
MKNTTCMNGEQHDGCTMTYKDFIKWSNSVPADCLTSIQAIHILAINSKIYNTPRLKRKKVWENEINVKGFVEKGLVRAVNNTVARRKGNGEP